MSETAHTSPYRCRACKAEVVWAKNADTGSTQIVDAAPSPRGNILVFVTPAGTMCRVIPKDEQEGLELRLDHHATCPEAQRFRRRRSG